MKQWYAVSSLLIGFWLPIEDSAAFDFKSFAEKVAKDTLEELANQNGSSKDNGASSSSDTQGSVDAASFNKKMEGARQYLRDGYYKKAETSLETLLTDSKLDQPQLSGLSQLLHYTYKSGKNFDRFEWMVSQIKSRYPASAEAKKLWVDRNRNAMIDAKAMHLREMAMQSIRAERFDDARYYKAQREAMAAPYNRHDIDGFLEKAEKNYLARTGKSIEILPKTTSANTVSARSSSKANDAIHISGSKGNYIKTFLQGSGIQPLELVTVNGRLAAGYATNILASEHREFHYGFDLFRYLELLFLREVPNALAQYEPNAQVSDKPLKALALRYVPAERLNKYLYHPRRKTSAHSNAVHVQHLIGDPHQEQWVGEDEFAKHDTKSKFIKEFFPKIKNASKQLELPLEISFVDHLRIGAYNFDGQNVTLSFGAETILQEVINLSGVVATGSKYPISPFGLFTEGFELPYRLNLAPSEAKAFLSQFDEEGTGGRSSARRALAEIVLRIESVIPTPQRWNRTGNSDSKSFKVAISSIKLFKFPDLKNINIQHGEGIQKGRQIQLDALSGKPVYELTRSQFYPANR